MKGLGGWAGMRGVRGWVGGIGMDIRGGARGGGGVLGLLTRRFLEVEWGLLGLLLFSLGREMASNFLFLPFARSAARLS